MARSKSKRRATECPSCDAELPDGAVLCVECGYHLERGEHLQTKKKRFSRRWDLGPNLPAQIGIAVLAVIAAVVCTVMYWPIGALALLGPVAVIAALGLFGKTLLIQRQSSGELLLTVIRRFFFVPMVTAQVDLGSYDAVYTSFVADDESESYFVELRGRRAPRLVVYNGGDHGTMKEILDCLQFDAGLEIRRDTDD